MNIVSYFITWGYFKFKLFLKMISKTTVRSFSMRTVKKDKEQVEIHKKEEKIERPNLTS